MRMKLITCALAFVLCYLVAAANGYTIEMYVSVDDKVKDVYRKNGMQENLIESKIKEDVNYVLSSIKDIFKELSKNGLNVDLRVIRLDFLNKNIFPSVTNGKIVNYKSRNEFLKYLQNNDIYKNLKYDLALHFTGYEMVNQKGGEIAGTAVHDLVCSDTGDSVGVVKLSGTYSTVLFTAHEIGHILGLYHDDDSVECFVNYIMSATIESVYRNKWFFSPCSIRDLKKLLSQQPCLQGQSSNSKAINKVQPSSEMLDMDEMCKRYGALYQCKDKNTQGDSVCHLVHCRPKNTTTDECNWVTHATEGMPCAAGRKCRFGKCIPARGVDPSVENGCVFGDQKELFVGNTKTCRSDKCGDPNVKDHCCQTCGHGEGGPITGDNQCEDDFWKCGKWQRGGDCVKVSTWMSGNCQKSCGTGSCKGLPGDCINFRGNTQCRDWAKSGECGKNPTYMNGNCTLACGLCKIDECKNLNGDTECNEWKGLGECDKNPKYMNLKCQLACGLCSTGSAGKNPKVTPRPAGCTEDRDPAWCMANKDTLPDMCRNFRIRCCATCGTFD